MLRAKRTKPPFFMSELPERVTGAVVNPAHPSRRWEGTFRIDTCATDCCVPAKHLRAIGLAPLTTRQYQLPNASARKLDATPAQIEFLDEVTAAMVVFGEDDSEPVLGAAVIESIGIRRVQPISA